MRLTSSAGSITADNADMAARPIHAGEDLFKKHINFAQLNNS